MDWRGRLGVDVSGSKVDPDAVWSSSLASSSVGSKRYINVKLWWVEVKKERERGKESA